MYGEDKITRESSLFLNYIHNFRAIAIILIVLGHSISYFSWSTYEKLSVTILFSNGTVLFVFIAGFLMQHLFFKHEHREFYKRKIRHVVLPYLVSSIPAIIIFIFFLERDARYVFEGFYEESIVMQISWFYLTGTHLAPFWFLPMIILIFSIAPLMKWGDKNDTLYFFLPILLIISFYFTRGGMPYENIIHFISIFILGMFFSKYKNLINLYLKKQSVLILLFFIISFLAAYEYAITGRSLGINFVQKLTMSIFLLGILFKYKDKIKISILNTMANQSFGIYLIHGYVISGIKFTYTIFIGELPSGTLIELFILAFFTIIISMITISSIKKVIGEKSRLIIGC